MKVTVTTTGSDEVIEYDLPDNELGFTNTILAENAHFKSLIDNHQSETDAAIRAERARVVKEFGKVLDCQSFTEAEQVMMLQSLYAQFEEDDTLTAEE